MESGDKFSSDELGSIGSGDTNTQIQHQVLFSLESQRVKNGTLMPGLVQPHTTQSNSNFLETNSTDVQDKWSLWNLSDAFKQNWHNQNENSVPGSGDTP